MQMVCLENFARAFCLISVEPVYPLLFWQLLAQMTATRALMRTSIRRGVANRNWCTADTITSPRAVDMCWKTKNARRYEQTRKMMYLCPFVLFHSV